tara:strand:+ start:2158 stop:2979 length:822 start_codon:yes stop_codon:yes gene_type:complete
MIISFPDYYQKARNLFPHKTEKNIYDIKLIKLDPYKKNNALTLSDNYLDLISSIGKQANKELNKLKLNKNEVMIPMGNPLKIKQLEKLCQCLIPQLETIFFGSYIHVSHTYIYRSQVTKNPPVASWLWHYDNYPVEIHKILIYLTDVEDAHSGPFEYIVSYKKGVAIINPSRTGPKNWKKPALKGSRIPGKVIQQYMSKGYKSEKVLGKAGTTLIFDNNCIHRANVALKKHRDVLVFQIKPSTKKLIPHLNPKWNGSFQHKGISASPGLLEPT